MSWALRRPLRKRLSGTSGGLGCGHNKQASTPLNIYVVHSEMTSEMIQRGRGALDFGQGHIHPPRADRPHHLRLATSFVIEVVIDGSVYEQKEPNYDSPMLIMTYGAILSLAILRDPFTQLNRTELLRFLQTCQKDDGGFVLRLSTDSRLMNSCHLRRFVLYPGSDERDLRMTYCAFSICAMLGDWSAINVERAIGFIQQCRVS